MAYDLLKLLHIAFAVCWLGGATALTLLVAHLRRRDPADAMAVLAHMPHVAARLFGPGGMGAAATGLLLGWMGGWLWSAWIVLAIVAVAALIALGTRVLDPLIRGAADVRAAGDPSAAAALTDAFLRAATLDLGIQWAVISLMVLKPGWGDPLLAVPAALALAGIAMSRARPSAPALPAA